MRRYLPRTAVILIVLAVGALVMGQVGAQIEQANTELDNRAKAAYGDDAATVSSDVCWDVCAPTAVNATQYRQDVLRVADRSNGWVTAWDLARAVPGITVDGELLAQLVQAGLLDKRSEGTLAGPTEYQYSGPAGRYERELTDSELRDRIWTQLRVFDGWMSITEIGNSVPAGEWRVRHVVAGMVSDGDLKVGQRTRGQLPWPSTTVYAHAQVSDPPAKFWADSLLVPFAITLGLVVVVGLVRGYRS